MLLFGRDTLLGDKLRNSEPTPAESARQRLCGIGRSNAIEESRGSLYRARAHRLLRQKAPLASPAGQVLGTISVERRRPQLIAPVIGWDFTRTTQIDTAQAQAVDLGDRFPIGAKHQKMADNRASRGLNQGHMAPGDPVAAAVETDPLRLARDKDDPGLLIRLIGNGRKGDLEARVEQAG